MPKKPLILAGGGINVARANENLRRFAEAENVPVVTTIMGKGAIPTTHRFMWETVVCTANMRQTRQSVSVIYFFQLGTRI